jgi:histidine triad (HIT) family protein
VEAEDVSDCVFCRIVAGEIPATEVERTDDAVVIRDLNPKAPTHVLVIPVRHADNLGDFVTAATPQEVGSLLALASKAGRDASGGGYRVVVNEGRDGGQTVGHVHLHVLAGRRMTWPPG